MNPILQGTTHRWSIFLSRPLTVTLSRPLTKKAVCLYGLLLFALLLSQPAAASDVVAEVTARELAFAQTMANRNLAAFGQFLSRAAVFFNGNTPIRGPEAIIAAWAPFFEDEQPPFSWAPDIVEVLDSGDLALSSGPVLRPDGTQAGRFNSIWRKESDGVWRVVFDKGS